MMYKIKQSKIIKLLAPFENFIFKGQKTPITKELIKKYLNKGDVFVTTEDDKEIKLTKQIAFEVMNPSQKYFTLNIDKISESYLSDFIDEIEIFYQLCYQKSDNLIIDIKGDEKKLKILFGDLVYLEEEEINNLYNQLNSAKNNEQFDFNIYSNDVSEFWDNKNYILNKISKDYAYVKKIASYLWEDESFIVELLNKTQYTIYEHISEDILFSSSFMSGVIKSDLFTSLWENCYKQWYHLEEKDKKKYKIEKYKNIALKVKDYFDNNLFNQPGKEYIYGIDLYRFIEYLPKEIREKAEIVELLSKNITKHNHIFLNKFLPDSYFNDLNNVIAYFSKIELRKHIVQDEVEHKKPYYRSWIHDKDKVLEVLKKVRGNNRDELSYFAIPFLKDINFYHEIKNIWADAYIYMPEKMNHSIEDIKNFILNGKKENITKISFENQYSVMDKDKELLKLWFNKFPEMLINANKNNEWVQKWCSDEKLISQLGRNIHIAIEKGLVSRPTMNKLMENNELIENILYDDLNFYFMLPLNKKLEPQFAYYFLTKNKTNYTKEKIEKKLWANKSFCLTALSVDKDYIKEISPQMFHNKNFLYDFFDDIDKGEISKNILNHIPSELKLLLEEFEIEENYKDFFKSFDINNRLQKELKTNSINQKPKI